jgi:pyruvate dehydrogenase E1 component
MYRFAVHDLPGRSRVRLLGSGAILHEVIAAGELLAQDWEVGSEIWSVTSFGELAREAREVERRNRFHPQDPPTTSHLQRSLPGAAPIVAVSDYVRAYVQPLAAHLAAPFTALGTDGFGRSDTRARLRAFFEVDRYAVAIAALQTLASAGALRPETVARAIARYGVDGDRPAPWMR